MGCTLARWLARNWFALFVLFVVVATAVGVAKLASERAEDAERASRLALQGQYDNRKVSFEACLRGNDDRLSRLENTLDIAQGNKDRADSWRELHTQHPLPPAIKDFAVEQEEANRAEYHRLIANAEQTADAQIPVSQHPKAKNPLRRGLVDCAEVYPLPARRGLPLPPPQK